MNFNSRDISRLIKNPQGQMAIATGDVRRMEHIVRQGREQDDEIELQRLLSHWGQQSLFKTEPPREVRMQPLRHRKWLEENADPRHPSFYVLKRILLHRW